MRCLRGAISAGMNVTIIDDVDALNKESANAMLKTLEEPPANTLLVRYYVTSAIRASYHYFTLPTFKVRGGL